MKKIFVIFSVLLMLFMNSCKKEVEPNGSIVINKNDVSAIEKHFNDKIILLKSIKSLMIQFPYYGVQIGMNQVLKNQEIR